MALFVTHGAIFLALKTDGPIRSDSRRIAERVGLVTAVLAVILLLLLGLSDGKAASWATTVVAAVALLGALQANRMGREGWAFLGTAVTIALSVATYFIMLFPNVMPSSTDPAYNLTIANASSSEYTLKVMTIVALIFTPLVLLYQGWTYWVFRKRLTTKHIPDDVQPEQPLDEELSGDALMKPFDPRLLRAVPSARRPVAALAAMGVAAGVATIATAFALTGLVVAVVDDGPLGPPAVWLAALFVARAILAWASELVAAWAGVSVSTALRRRWCGAGAFDEGPPRAVRVRVPGHGRSERR